MRENGYNLDLKNPHAVDDGPGDPDELLRQYEEATRAAVEIREKLKVSLAEALER